VISPASMRAWTSANASPHAVFIPAAAASHAAGSAGAGRAARVEDDGSTSEDEEVIIAPAPRKGPGGRGGGAACAVAAAVVAVGVARVHEDEQSAPDAEPFPGWREGGGEGVGGGSATADVLI
jgi:hypothetical protein